MRVFIDLDKMRFYLSVGATVRDSIDLKFLYENHPDFSAIPTFFILPGLILQMSSSMISTALTHTEFDLSQVLHGEQYLEILDDLPTEGKLVTQGKVIDVIDKRSGAVVVANCKIHRMSNLKCNKVNSISFLGDSFDQSGKLLVKNQISTFIVGAGNFGGKTKGSNDVIESIPTPNRQFDESVKFVTSVDQAALYRFVFLLFVLDTIEKPYLNRKFYFIQFIRRCESIAY